MKVRLPFIALLFLCLAPCPNIWAQVPLAFSPARNAVGAPVAGPISATFTAPLAAAVAAGLRVAGNQTHGRQPGTITQNGATLTFQPSVPFGPGEKVTVTIPSTSSAQPPFVYEFTAAAGVAAATFGPRQMLAVGVLPQAVAPFDFDGDGDLDLAVANQGNGGTTGTGLVTFYRNNGLGTFTATPLVHSGKYANDITAVDLDLDGDLDLLYVQFYQPHVRALLNDGTGNFVFLGIFDGGQSDVLAADFTGDGYPDFASPADDQNALTIGISTGSPPGFTTASLANTAGVIQLTSADFDGDGDLDVVSRTGTAATPYVQVLLNNGRGQLLAAPNLALPAGALSIVAADFDRDGWPDLLMDAYTPVRSLMFCRNLRNGTFAAPVSQSLGTFNIGRLVAADLNGDGDLDLLLPSGSAVRVLLGNGSGQFSTGPVLTTTGPVIRAYAADLNGDGRLDVATAIPSTNSVQYFFNQAALPAATAASAARSSLTLYPNPARHAATLLLPPAAHSVQVLDALGREVRQLTVAAQTTTATLDLAGLPAGVYAVRCGAAATRLVVEK